LDEARFDLEKVKCQIRQSIQEWQVSATTSCLLELVREAYEKQRQPETLKEASDFLCQISGGHYTRIWTKLSEDVLLVDTAEGESLPVEILSRGTRECVYLGLRLALVTAYARRGVVLPLVLDDVLVNFDTARAKEVAHALKIFSEKGYQVILFTCHDHIRELFIEMDCDVRELPHHAEIVDRDETVIRPRLVAEKGGNLEGQSVVKREIAESQSVIHVPAISGGVNYDLLNRRLGYEFSLGDPIGQIDPVPISWPAQRYEIVDQADERIGGDRENRVAADDEAA
ncbi:MAG: hypothetical protein VX438_08165, partial [Planctomycetota bacterium]|nr:hypothetical protein [Planctomycetota bacterium]